MKKSKLLFVLTILMFLYIGPVLFTSSPAIAGTNMNKDFSLSADGWLTGWTYRKAVLIDSGTGAGTNYTVPISVSYSSKMQSDFDDIRFTDSDNITLLDHWRESYTASTTALFWVEVTADLGSNQVIGMYYGNDEASSLSNGNATFLFYEDWSSQSLDAWTVASGQPDGQITYSPTGATQGGYVAKVEGDVGDSYLIYTDYAQTALFATRFRANIEEATTGNAGRMGTGWAGAYGWAFIQTLSTGDIFSVYDDDGNPDSQSMTNTYFDSYTVWEIQRGTGVLWDTYAKLFAEDVEIETGSFHPDEVSNPVCSIQVTDSEDDIYSDWVVCRKFVAAEPEFNSFGEEENNFVWHVVNDAELVFSVAIDETGLDLLLIFLGLCMIPVSMLYMVKGGTSEMSTNKFFYGLIFFFLGWGLFLGGILL